MKWLLGLVSILIGLIFSFYHFKGANQFGELYSPLALNENSPSFAVDEGVFYASKTREIMNGSWWLGDVEIKEYKNTPSPFIGEAIPTIMMAILSKLGGNINTGFILADLIFPSLVFTLLSLIFNQLTDKKFLSFVGALGTMISYHFLSYFPYFPSMVKIIIQAFNTGAYSHLIRSFHPQISLGLFLAWVLLFFKFLNNFKNDPRLKWWLGGLLGLLIYSHLFYWSFAFAWIGVNLCLFLYKKDVKKVKSLGLILIIGLTLGLFYWFNLYWFFNSPLKQDFVLNSWFATSWHLRDTGLIILMMGLTKLAVKKQAQFQFWISFFITSLVILIGSQLLNLGFDDPIGHWLLRVIYPLTTIFCFSLLFNYLKRDNYWLSIGLVLLLISYQGRVHWQYFKNNSQAFIIEPERLELYDWLNLNTPKGSVVMTASLKENLYLPIYTHNNIFIPRSQISLAPTEESIERFLIAQKLEGKANEDIKAMFQENKMLKQAKRFDFDNCAGVYLFFRRYIKNDYYNCSVPEQVLDDIIYKYENLTINMNKYQSDYWLGENVFDQGLLLWENQKYKIYKIN